MKDELLVLGERLDGVLGKWPAFDMGNGAPILSALCGVAYFLQARVVVAARCTQNIHSSCGTIEASAPT